MEENEPTLAEKIEALNGKINEVIERQTALEKELKQNQKVLMQRINKIQEYNEIDDMRSRVLTKQLNVILKQLKEIKEKLY